MWLTGRRWVSVNAPQLAAAISFNAIVSLAPLLVLLLTMVSRLLGSEAAQAYLFSAVRRMAGDPAVPVARTLTEMVAGARGGWLATAAGLAVLAYFSSAMFLQLRMALSRIWGVSGGITLKRALIEQGLSFVMVSAAVAAASLTLLIGFVGSIASPLFAEALPRGSAIWRLLSGVMSFGIVGLLVAFLFRQVPGVKVRWSDVWLGALLTSLLFNAGNFLIGRFIGKNLLVSLYGAAGALVLALLWVYYGTQMLLFGAAFTRVYAERHGSLRESALDAGLQSMRRAVKSH